MCTRASRCSASNKPSDMLCIDMSCFAEFFNNLKEVQSNLRNSHRWHLVLTLDESALKSARKTVTSTLMKGAPSLCQCDTFLEKEPRSYQQLRPTVSDILENHEQNILNSQNDRRKGSAASALKEKAKTAAPCLQEDHAQKARSVASNMTQRRRQGKRGNTVSPVRRDNSAERQKGRKTGRSPSGNGDRPLCVIIKKQKCTQDRECDCWTSPAFQIFIKGQCQFGKGLSVYSPTQTRSIALRN